MSVTFANASVVGTANYYAATVVVPPNRASGGLVEYSDTLAFIAFNGVSALDLAQIATYLTERGIDVQRLERTAGVREDFKGRSSKVIKLPLTV